MELDYERIGQRIKRLRTEKAGIRTQAMLAEKSDLSTNYISMIERGLVKFSYEAAVSISAALGVTPDFLSEEVKLSNNIPADICEMWEKLTDRDVACVRALIKEMTKANKKQT